MNELLNNIIMDEIGLEVSNTYIVDQDYGNLINFNGKNLRYFGGETEVELNRGDLIFDVTNLKVISMLFAFYLNKLHNLEGRYFKIFYPVVEKDGSGSLKVLSNEEEISSDTFYCEYLRYIDMILKISGSYIDIHKFDDPTCVNNI